MKLSHGTFRLAAMAALVTALTGAAYGQSLADLARQERARKARAAGSGRVFTNENIPAPSISARPSETEAPAQPGDQEAAAPVEGEEPSQAELEKEYRERFARLREELSFEERKLDVLQRELNLAQMQHYSDPEVALREQHTREEINKRTEEIEAQRQAVEKAKQAIADLEEELRRNSLPAGWAR